MSETQLQVVDAQQPTDIDITPHQSNAIGTMRQLVPQTISEAAILARAFHRAGMFGLRSEDQALTLIMTGMELGLAPATAVRGIHVIEGKPSLSADLMVALCKARRDVCAYFTVIESTNDVATCRTLRRGDPGPVTQSFTIEDAKTAGLLTKAGGTWQKHPGKMLLARCKSALARAVYEDLVMGLYTPDELKAGEAYDYVQAEVEAARDEVPRDAEAITLRHAIAAYLECMEAGPQEKAFEGIRKWANLDTFKIPDLDNMPVEWLRALQANIVKWQAPKPVDVDAPPKESIAKTQAAEVKQKVNQAKAQSPAETPVDAATTVAQLTDEDKARIEAEEARLQAEEAAKAQQSLGVEDELEDPFAEN